MTNPDEPRDPRRVHTDWPLVVVGIVTLVVIVLGVHVF
jgi:hypothetical protein